MGDDGVYWVIPDEDAPFADEHDARCACMRDADNQRRHRMVERQKALNNNQPGEGN
jgi:hypothetical protein